MLNEILEFEEYTEKLGDCSRLESLRKDYELKSLSGLDRAFFIIARGFAFDKKGNFDEERGLEGLKNWCGFGEGESVLKKIIGDENWENYVKPKKMQFESRLFVFGGDETDLKAVTYARALADAYNAGPLKNYYLRCDREFFESCEFTNTGKKKNNIYSLKFRETPKTTCKKNKYNQTVDSALKLTACYLLSKSAGSDYAFINQTNLVNWGTLSREKLSDLQYNGEPLYDKYSSSNTIIMTMPAEWIKHFAVVEEKDIPYSENDEHVYWEDRNISNLKFIPDMY